MKDYYQDSVYKPTFSQYINGDIREAKSGYIIQGVNAQGKMGSGLAKSIMDKWPNVRQRYIEKYKNQDNNLYLGSCQFVHVESYSGKGLWVVNLVTQENFGYDGELYLSYSGLEVCLHNMVKIIQKGESQNTPNIIHVPKIGCGLAGGDWEEVKKIIKKTIPSDFEVIHWDYA